MSLRRRNVLAFGVLLLGIFLLLALTSVSAAQSQTFAYMNITGGYYPSGENITFMENNWIKLHKEVEVDIPGLTFIYNGFTTAGPYSKDGRTISITVNAPKDTDHKVHYPFNKHQFFYHTSTVYATLETDLTGSYYYYIASTYPTEVKGIVEMLVDGDTTEFRNLFLGGINGTLNANTKTTIGKLNTGDYLMIVTDNPLNTSPDFRIIAVTGIEVLEYESELTAPPHPVRRGDDLTVTMSLTSAPSAEYRYGGALIKREDYVKSHEIKLVSPGNKDGTSITFDGVIFVENWKIMGVGLTNIDAATINTKISDILSAGGYEGAVYYPGITSSTSETLVFNTDDLPLGTYVLSVGVWQSGSNRLVAFAQTKIVVAAAPAAAPIGGGRAAVAPPPGVTTIPTEPTGEVTATVTAYSPDRRTSVTIPAGTIAKDAAGNPLTAVTVTSPSALPAGVPVGTEYVGIAIELGPAGAPFSQPVEISITFDPAKFEGKTPMIYVYEAGAWTPLETTIVDNKAIAKVDHFSIFTLLAASIAPTPTPTPVVTPTPPPPVTPTPTPTPAPPFPVVPLVAVIAIVIVVILVAVAFGVLRRKK